MKVRNRKKKLQYKIHTGNLKCTCCGSYHKSWSFCLDQAHRCSSIIWLYDNTIHSNYGSRFDTDKFNIINASIIKEQHRIAYNSRESRKDQYGRCDDHTLLICDSCIQKYLDKGFIVKDESYNYWEPVDKLSEFYYRNPDKYMKFMREHGLNALIAMREEDDKGLWD